MGSLISSQQQQQENSCREARKRTHNELHDDDTEDSNNVVEIPKRKKIKGTSGYIYQTLFVGGEGSDITISALGEEWKVHKIYLKQSKYFQSMFSGQWKESKDNYISIQVPDDLITVEAMNTALGSLYSDDVAITTGTVVPLLATSCLLQLDNLAANCSQLMKETINSQTVCPYLTAAKQYGESDVEVKCIEWLERRLTSSWTINLLKEISVELMHQVIESPNLFVMQIEIDIYTLLIIWVFLKLNPTWTGTSKEARTQSSEFFRNQVNNPQAFLSTPEGEEFVLAFKGLRLPHVINDLRSMVTLQSDNVIPPDWLHSVYKEQWKKILFVYQNLDHGPPENMGLDKFNSIAHRYGRILEKNTKYCWRWTGFLYGLDIIVMYNNRTRQLTFRRNTYIHPTHGIVCIQRQHSFLVKLEIASFNNNGGENYYKSSGVRHISLSLDEEAQILQVDKNVSYPIYVSARIAMVTVPMENN